MQTLCEKYFFVCVCCACSAFETVIASAPFFEFLFPRQKLFFQRILQSEGLYDVSTTDGALWLNTIRLLLYYHPFVYK